MKPKILISLDHAHARQNLTLFDFKTLNEHSCIHFKKGSIKSFPQIVPAMNSLNKSDGGDSFQWACKADFKLLIAFD